MLTKKSIINLVEPPIDSYEVDVEAYIEAMGGIEDYDKYQKELDQIFSEIVRI